MLLDGQIRMVIESNKENPESLIRRLRDKGINVETSYENLIQVVGTPEQLDSLEDRDITLIRQPQYTQVPVIPGRGALGGFYPFGSLGATSGVPLRDSTSRPNFSSPVGVTSGPLPKVSSGQPISLGPNNEPLYGGYTSTRVPSSETKVDRVPKFSSSMEAGLGGVNTKYPTYGPLNESAPPGMIRNPAWDVWEPKDSVDLGGGIIRDTIDSPPGFISISSSRLPGKVEVSIVDGQPVYNASLSRRAVPQ